MSNPSTRYHQEADLSRPDEGLLLIFCHLHTAHPHHTLPHPLTPILQLAALAGFVDIVQTGETIPRAADDERRSMFHLMDQHRFAAGEGVDIEVDGGGAFGGGDVAGLEVEIAADLLRGYPIRGRGRGGVDGEVFAAVDDVAADAVGVRVRCAQLRCTEHDGCGEPVEFIHRGTARRCDRRACRRGWRWRGPDAGRRSCRDGRRACAMPPRPVCPSSL